jgi:hypothetical protein
LQAIFQVPPRVWPAVNPDACNQEPFSDFVLHRVTFVAFVASDIPIDDKARVPAAGLRHRLLRLEFGFRFALVLKTKDRIGFVSFFGLGSSLGPSGRDLASPGRENIRISKTRAKLHPMSA